MLCCIIDDVAVLRTPQQNLKTDRAVREAVREFIEQEIRSSPGGLLFVEVIDPRFRLDPVPAVSRGAVRRDEPHRGDSKITLAGEARRRGLWRLYECQC